MAASPWSLERVVNELRQLHAGGESITYGVLRAGGFGALVSAAERYAGSFTHAIKLAGIEPARPQWTRQRVVAEIKRLHREGIALSSEQLAKGGHSGFVQAARKLFGSWPGAVSAAGAPRFKRGQWHSWSQIRDALRQLHRGNARMTIAALEADGHSALVSAARETTGGWNQALKRAKIPLVQEHLSWSAEQVLDGIRALDRAGIVLNANQVIAAGHRKLVKAATWYYGTWQEACRAAVPGYAPLVERWTVERLLGRIRERHRAGLSVRSTDVDKEEPTLTAAAHRLEVHWRDAVRRAGVPRSAIAPRPPSPRVRWNEDKIFAVLEAARRDGRPLLTRTFRGSFVGAVLRRYGSWPAAMRAAGLARPYASDVATARANRLGGATVRSKRPR